MRQTIRFTAFEQEVVTLRPEGYRFFSRKEGDIPGRYYVARTMWRLLEKWGYIRPWEHQYSTYSFTPQDQGDIMKRLEGALMNLFDRGEDPNEYAMAVGAKDFEEVTGAIIDQEFYFNFTEDFRVGRNGRLFNFRGLKGVVLPRHEGVCLIPLKMLWEREDGKPRDPLTPDPNKWGFGYAGPGS